MEKYYYIKRTIEHVACFDEQLDVKLFDNIGTTWKDYVDGKLVMLNDDLVSFFQEYPTASLKEIWDMALTPPYERTLEDAKREKLEQITEYDNSDSVNQFSVNGFNMWLDKATRTGLLLRITAELASGNVNTTLWFGTTSFVIPVTQALQVLYAIEIYASCCYDRTAAHKAAVETLDSIEAVDAYDYMLGYPLKLVFTI